MNDYEPGTENSAHHGQSSQYRPDAPAQPEQQPVQGDWSPQNGGYAQYSAYQRSYGGGEPGESRSSLGRMAAGSRGAGRQIPYQYSTTGGWQQERRPDGYRWDYAEYDRAAVPVRGRRNRGLVVFAVSLLCLLSVGLLVLTGYNILMAVYGPSDEGMLASSQMPPPQSRPQTQSGMPSAQGGGDISMAINSKPPVSQSPTPAPGTGRLMTIPQVRRRCARR